MYKNAIFDVDGTILNTLPGVSGCIEYALKRLNKPVLSIETMKKFLGPALRDSFKNIALLNDEETELAVKYYRERYSEGGAFDCILFDGYPQIFERLKNEGVRLSVASSKPKKYIDLIFERLNILHYFEKTIGPLMDHTSSDKSLFIKEARLESDAIMIGDREFDILASKKVGIDSIAVTYAFTDLKEFEVCKPTYLASNTAEIFDIVTRSRG